MFCATSHSTFNIEHSTFLLFSVRGGEANGVWWPPRSSKPLFRRGSVERLVRFRHASAIVGVGGWELGVGESSSTPNSRLPTSAYPSGSRSSSRRPDGPRPSPPLPDRTASGPRN